MSYNVTPKTTGSKQLFKNKFLESLTRTHVSIPISIFFIYATALMVYSIKTNTDLTILATVGLFFLGFFTFTLAEYLIHRFIFHIPGNTETKKKLQYTLHGVHHEYPKDKQRLAMPPVMSIVIGTLFLFVFRLFLGDLVFAFLPGFLVGYASYLCVHYILHIFKPPNNRLKYLWAIHAVHHYKDQTKAYGVTSPLWDYVFGTMPEKV
jgi:sterol desaturase/sphingolipid hydroxylase (fatty acid hydroxylase superfamily)